MESNQAGRAITVVVADDEPHVLEYLRTVLHLDGMTVVGSALDAGGAVELVHRLRPDVALLDLRMPGGGLEAARLIGSLSSNTRIVIFSSHADEADLLPLLRAGIDGYVVKGCSPERLSEALRSAVAGEHYLAPKMSRLAADELAGRLRAEEQEGLHTLRLRERIGAALGAHGFVTLFQPIVDLAAGELHSVEALTRFTTLPFRPPDQWLADADQCGLRVAVEIALAGAALQQLDRLDPALVMSINVSPGTVLSGRLPEVLVGRPLHRVVLEVTEHAPVHDYAALAARLAPWRAGGARLAVDDAGAGFASFAHILELSPDFIKLDTRLTHDIHVDVRRQALARALIGFAQEMEVLVVAEGVETQPQLDELRALGAHLAQGFHLGRPRPIDEQPHLLAEDEVDLREPFELDRWAPGRARRS